MQHSPLWSTPGEMAHGDNNSHSKCDVNSVDVVPEEWKEGPLTKHYKTFDASQVMQWKRAASKIRGGQRDVKKCDIFETWNIHMSMGEGCG
jgi:hypothetical protein